MVNLRTVQAHNATLKTLAPGLVAVFETFSLAKCGAHASLMGNFFLESMARQYPHTSFVHAYPSGVATGLMRELPIASGISAVLELLLRPFMVPVQESGERHLLAATSGRVPCES
ncbi:hypothetical protein NUU61_005294 [Penicillium alfredii]|uniref:Uncharacterized protein n=1 Tax=Penicillium alfredii TaxID=1506179 RepID=A0A9W9K7F6_9EURO|nr:uncharacterized protein NUU61_005294 [Penicillium alfredii]KAJ5095938.1 hypothetical protein NUU61_005294 [Penicillium alfredii]